MIQERYVPMSFEERQRLLEAKWEPYKLYGDPYQILNLYRPLSPKRISYKEGFVVFHAGKYENDIADDFEAIDQYSIKVGELYNLQMEYSHLWDRHAGNDELNKVKAKIDKLSAEIKEKGAAEKVEDELTTDTKDDKIQEAETDGKLPKKQLELIIETLNPLKGYWNGKKIMEVEHYSKVMEFTVKFISGMRIPDDIQQIPNTNVSIEFIRKTFHCLYKNFKKPERRLWVSLLHKLFRQFGKDGNGFTEESTYKNFNVYRGNYEIDKNTITYNY